MLVTVGGSGGFMPDTIVMMVHTLMPAMIAISNTTRPIMISMRLVVLGLRSDFRLSRVAMRMAPGGLKSEFRGHARTRHRYQAEADGTVSKTNEKGRDSTGRGTGLHRRGKDSAVVPRCLRLVLVTTLSPGQPDRVTTPTLSARRTGHSELDGSIIANAMRPNQVSVGPPPAGYTSARRLCSAAAHGFTCPIRAPRAGQGRCSRAR